MDTEQLSKMQISLQNFSQILLIDSKLLTLKMDFFEVVFQKVFLKDFAHRF